MNKRIKKLADDAAKYSAIMTLPTGQSGDELFVEKFAELIVRECCEWCDAYAADDGTAQKIKANIKNHFGVE